MKNFALKDALQSLGELFITGFSGLELSGETSTFLSQAGIGGVILFSHNFENPGQVAELSNQIQEIRPQAPLWISVDHEGGKVQRFKKGFTKIPEAATIGAAGSPQLAYEVSQMIARELKAVGVNLNFCPVADIATNPKNPVIGNRAYGTDSETVSKMVTAVVRGHLISGVQPCVKHFPGHGDTSTDSHFALPKVDITLETLEQREFIPFIKAFKSGCSIAMSAHILNSQLNPELPATLSKDILQGILRQRLRYTKVIISDDMEMKAITEHFGATEAPRLALEAGCDLLTFRTEGAARIAYESLVRALETGALEKEIVLRAAARVRALKKEALTHTQPASVSEVGQKIGTPENLSLIQKVEELARRD